jgi:hypothetical protein
MLLPIYGVPCLLAAWKMGRRWGTLFAALTGIIGPLVAAKEPIYNDAVLICWNSLMRFLILQMCVFLTDRIHRHRNFFRRLTMPGRRPADLAGNWAVALASALWFLLVAAGDI